MGFGTLLRRRVDSRGRIALPVELRWTLGITPNDIVEMQFDGLSLILKKSMPACCICESPTNLRKFKGRVVCGSCWDALRQEHTGLLKH